VSGTVVGLDHIRSVLENFERLLERDFREQFRRIFDSLIVERGNLRELTARLFDGRPLGEAEVRSIAVGIEKASRNMAALIDQIEGLFELDRSC
jgi:hypothetical protein